jgi:hypothetical protein
MRVPALYGAPALLGTVTVTLPVVLLPLWSSASYVMV